MRIFKLSFIIMCLIQASTVYADQCQDDCYATYYSCIEKQKDGEESQCKQPMQQCVDSCPQEATTNVNPCRQKCDAVFSRCVSDWKEGHEFLCDQPLSRCYAACP